MMPIERISPGSAARIAADAAIECINCGICYAACDTVRWNDAYLGPAALNRAWSLVNDERDAGKSRAARGRRCIRRMPCLPLAPVLPGALPAGAQSHGIHRRAQAPDVHGLSQGRAQGMNVRLYVWQRATAAIMVPLVLVHVAVIFYATRKGMSAADILGRTRGSVLWALFYGVFVIAVAIHAAIGLRNVLVEWSPLNDRTPASWRRSLDAVCCCSGCAPSLRWCCHDAAGASHRRAVGRGAGAPAFRPRARDLPAAAFLDARACHRGRRRASTISCAGAMHR